MNNFSVNWPSGKTDFLFGHFIKIMNDHYADRKVVYICDEKVYDLYAGISDYKSVIKISATENRKTLSIIEKIYQKLIGFEADKKTTIISIGGGLTCDMAGYVASTYYRGMPLVLVPTTLLSMIDAAIGGKNGVNFGQHKNLIGTIRQPERIIFDTCFLKTLSPEQLRSGMAEVIKHGIISGDALFNEIQKSENIAQLKNGLISEEFLKKIMQVKIDIVSRDENEAGLRRKLNFGHTLGHIIELEENRCHGEAISIGMAMAAKLSKHLNKCDQATVDRIMAILNDYNLPVVSTMDIHELLRLLSFDKKKEGDEINFLFLEEIGKVVVEKISLNRLKEILLEVF